MPAYEWKVDQGQLRDIIKRLGNVSNGRGRSKYANAINKTATQVTKQAKAKAKAKYTYKGTPNFKTVQRASPGNLTATMKSSGPTESLSKFMVRANSGGSAAQVSILKGQFSPVQKNGNKGFTGKGKLPGNQIFVRTGSSRLPIEKIKGKSQPYMVGNREIIDPIAQQEESILAQMIDKEIQRILGS